MQIKQRVESLGTPAFKTKELQQLAEHLKGLLDIVIAQNEALAQALERVRTVEDFRYLMRNYVALRELFWWRLRGTSEEEIAQEVMSYLPPTDPRGERGASWPWRDPDTGALVVSEASLYCVATRALPFAEIEQRQKARRAELEASGRPLTRDWSSAMEERSVMRQRVPVSEDDEDATYAPHLPRLAE